MSAEVTSDGSIKDDNVNAIPPHIAANLLVFLRRVQSTGEEAVAWVEAYQFVQKLVPTPQK
jgi:hypothetical protein